MSRWPPSTRAAASSASGWATDEVTVHIVAERLPLDAVAEAVRFATRLALSSLGDSRAVAVAIDDLDVASLPGRGYQLMRVFNRLFLLVLGVALAAAGVLVVIEAAWAWAGSGFVGAPVGQWLATFKATPWSAPIVIAISVAVAAAGLVLVVLEVRPQRKRHAVFATGSGEWLLLRRSTEGHLQRRLAAQSPPTGSRSA